VLPQGRPARGQAGQGERGQGGRRGDAAAVEFEDGVDQAAGGKEGAALRVDGGEVVGVCVGGGDGGRGVCGMEQGGEVGNREGWGVGRCETRRWREWERRKRGPPAPATTRPYYITDEWAPWMRSFKGSRTWAPNQHSMSASRAAAPRMSSSAPGAASSPSPADAAAVGLVRRRAHLRCEEALNPPQAGRRPSKARSAWLEEAVVDGPAVVAAHFEVAGLATAGRPPPPPFPPCPSRPAVREGVARGVRALMFIGCVQFWVSAGSPSAGGKRPHYGRCRVKVK